MKLNLRDPAERQRLQAFIASGKLATLEEYELQQLYRDLEAYDKAMKTEAAQSSLIKFCCWMDPTYKPGKIHHMIAERLQRVCDGTLLRLAVSMPPRAGKSRLISELFPAYYLGHHPEHKLIAASNNTDLAESFGRKVRNNIDSGDFQMLFPNTKVSKDSSSAGRWATTKSGEAYYTGVGGALAGRGSHLCLSGDSQVVVNGAITRIDAIKQGDTILTPYGQQKVTATSLTIHNTAYTLNQQITASAQHQFLTARGWLESQQFRVGDKIRTQTVWRLLWLTGRNILRKRLLTKRGGA